MRFLVLQALLCLPIVFAQAPQQSPIDWKTATDLPNVDLSGLSPAQRKAALEAMREFPCLCGCGLKIAECRVKDTSCGDSRAFAAIVVKAVKEGKDPEEALRNSGRAKLRAAASRILGDRVAIPIQGAPSKGPAAARITLVEFSDFECPYCSAAAVKVEAVLKAYPNDVRLVYKQFPLPSHPHAMMASAAALAAQAQGKFWPMHDRLFAHHAGLSPETIAALAKEIGLDMARFRADMQAASIRRTIDQDVADGDKLIVDSTPTFFINGKKYNGTLEMMVLKPILDAELTGK
jgi:protein-disulfide isomerase